MIPELYIQLTISGCNILLLLIGLLTRTRNIKSALLLKFFPTLAGLALAPITLMVWGLI